MEVLPNSLVIENFRSLRGQVVIPLEAQVVLIHGSNGIGKTSVLSALELALTGEIAHLQRTGKDYRKHLLHMGTAGGSVSLVSKESASSGDRARGELQIHSTGFVGTPMLSADEAKFFSERCYLPQTTLGRLLEIYEDVEINLQTSPLIRFVKDLLGLDQLDALLDGLKPAFHVTRIRNLVPEYRRFDKLQKELKREVETLVTRQREETAKADGRRTALFAMLNELYDLNSPVHGLGNKLVDLRDVLESDQTEDRQLIDIRRRKTELESLLARWKNIPQDLAANERHEKEAEEQAARGRFAEWQKTYGEQLTEIITGLADIFPDFLR